MLAFQGRLGHWCLFMFVSLFSALGLVSEAYCYNGISYVEKENQLLAYRRRFCAIAS